MATITELLKLQKPKVLNQEQIDSFMKNGFLTLPGAIDPEKGDMWMEEVWNRLGMYVTTSVARSVPCRIWWNTYSSRQRTYILLPLTFSPSLLTSVHRDPNDKSTWHRERTNMPSHRKIAVSEIAPIAWEAICELCGGEDRIDDKGKAWSDGFIVNLGSPEGEGKEIPPKELDNCKYCAQ